MKSEKFSSKEVLNDFIDTMNRIDNVQEDQDLTCSCTNCYWNYIEANNQCVSESLSEFKMTPNSIECKGYWER